MTNILIILCFTICIITLPLASFAIASESDNFEMPLGTIDSGGRIGSSNNYNLNCSSGQSTPIGRSTSEKFILNAGFQQSDVIPTLITLSSFTGKAVGEKVILKWQTGTEIANLGFNVLRSKSEEDGYVKINRNLIKAKGSSTKGASYTFNDKKVEAGKTYFYKLEDIDSDKGNTQHDTLKIEVTAKKSKKKKK